MVLSKNSTRRLSSERTVSRKLLQAAFVVLEAESASQPVVETQSFDAVAADQQVVVEQVVVRIRAAWMESNRAPVGESVVGPVAEPVAGLLVAAHFASCVDKTASRNTSWLSNYYQLRLRQTIRYEIVVGSDAEDLAVVASYMDLSSSMDTNFGTALVANNDMQRMHYFQLEVERYNL